MCFIFTCVEKVLSKNINSVMINRKKSSFVLWKVKEHVTVGMF